MNLLDLKDKAYRDDTKKCWTFEVPLKVSVKFFYTAHGRERIEEEQVFDIKELYLNCFFDKLGHSKPYWQVISYKVL